MVGREVSLFEAKSKITSISAKFGANQIDVSKVRPTSCKTKWRTRRVNLAVVVRQKLLVTTCKFTVIVIVEGNAVNVVVSLDNIDDGKVIIYALCCDFYCAFAVK